jgi:glycosyltransferase involved in cell wall biosynthesis
VPGPPVNPAVEAISAFFPCYNDAYSIETVVRAVYGTLERLGVDFEVIVINDASTDHSGDVLDALTEHLPLLRVVHHEYNRGYGGAILSGFATARKQWVFYTDGDGQYDPTELELLVKEVTDDVDVVQGFKIHRGDGPARAAIGWLYHQGVKRLFALGVRDTDCDFRLIRRAVLERVQLFHTSGVICVEMVRKLQDVGARFVEVPVHHYPRMHGRSQFLTVKRVVRAMGGLLMLRVELWLERHRTAW